MATGHEVRMYNDITDTRRALQSIAISLESIETSLEVIANALKDHDSEESQ